MKAPSKLPLAILALTLLIAAIIAGGGLWLAREQRTERIELDRTNLIAFADSLQEELHRLESAYNDRLERLVAESSRMSNLELKERAGEIWGIQQFSLLRTDGRSEFHLEIEESQVPLPVPVFDEQSAPPGANMRLLNREVVGIGFPGTTGWVSADQSTGGASILFWKIPAGNEQQVAVITVDPVQVGERIDNWLREWLEGPFQSFRTSDGRDLVTGPYGDLVDSGKSPVIDADQVRAMRTRFGAWQLHSWDPRREIVSFRPEVVKGAAALASLVTIGGLLAFFKLRQALLLVEQRVSFANHVSHELRTPLTNILLNADLAAEGASPAGRRRLDLVRDEAGRLRRLIDNVLSFSARRQRTTKSQMPVTGRCEAKTVTNDLLSQFSTALRRKGIAVEAEVETAAWAAAPADAVAQIVGNLISNVEKYAADGGLMQVKVWDEGEEVIFSVADRGPGIARSQRDKIFEAFQRLNDRVTEGSSGTGLGLSIARDLAEDFGGRLRLVDGELDGETGAVFELRLPLAEEPITVLDFPKTKAS